MYVLGCLPCCLPAFLYSLQQALPVSKEIMMLTGRRNEFLERRVSPFLSENRRLPQISLSYGISSVTAGRKGTVDQHVLLWTSQWSSFTSQWSHRRNRITSSANTFPRSTKTDWGNEWHFRGQCTGRETCSAISKTFFHCVLIFCLKI